MQIRIWAAWMAIITFGSSVAVMRAQDVGGTATAETSGQDAGKEAKHAADLSLEDLANVTIYTASKHMQSASDAPASVTVVTADEIQRYGFRTLADILESVRGFYITYDRAYSFVGVRGFGRLGDWNSRVLVLIDGHRINDNILGQAMLGSEFPLDVDMIDRIEIVRGPSSSLYGAGAFFAVINVLTRKAPQLKGGEISFSPGSFGSYQGRAAYGGRYKEVDMLLSATFYNSQGQGYFIPAFNSPATNNGITSGTDYQSYEHILADVDFHGFSLQGLFSTHTKGVPTGYFGAIFNDPRTLNLDIRQYIDLSYRHSIGGKWELSARVSNDESRLQAPVALPTGLPDGSSTLNTYSDRGNWWDSEIKLSRTFFDRHKVTVGSEITNNRLEDQGDYDSASKTFVPASQSSQIWAFYAQDEYAIASKLSLSGGVRYDHYSNFGGTTNPRLGLIYHVLHPTTLKLLYGTAFRAPYVFEIQPDFGSFLEGNPNLRPERIRSVEGVVEEGMGPHFKLSASVFRNWINDLITQEPDLSNGLVRYDNVGKAAATGLELEFNARTPSGLESTASYSYTRTVDGQTQGTTSNSPQHLGKLDVSVPFLQRRLFASLDAQYTSAVQTLAGKTLSGYPVFNGTLLGHGLGKHLDLSGTVYNLLNRKYFDPGRPEDPEDAIQQNGINFGIKLTFKF